MMIYLSLATDKSLHCSLQKKIFWWLHFFFAHARSPAYLPPILVKQKLLLTLGLQIFMHISQWKTLKSLTGTFGILAFFTNFCPIKTDLSGNTVWPQTSVFQKLVKMSIFGIFN